MCCVIWDVFRRKIAVETAFSHFNEELIQLDLANLEPMATPGYLDRSKESIKSISYKLSVPKDKARAVCDRFAEQLEQILQDPRRVKLFLEAEHRHLCQFYQELQNPV